MATIGEYIDEIVKDLRLPLGIAALSSFYVKNGVSSTDELTKDNIEKMDIALIGVIPTLLLMPDKTTGDTSLKWDRSAVLSYYRLKCAEYGIPDDQATPPNEIIDISNRW